MISSILPGSLFRLSSGMRMFEIEGEPGHSCGSHGTGGLGNFVSKGTVSYGHAVIR